ncbi:unnamed protein product [Rotaria socialis]|uniref:Uncharacterized protein n=1 Tax=Rotaria socialis TaxID=392032 RepID=A0A820XSZ6_9BILA|nr:unnamed protein product [Rotaria socialis]CAF4446200.1 unnamed protein product [Rotaria socialis]CAF4509944.1 unnamed protein product [Rotaria socialis]CAF4537202.1 unnamed protein product [Rotaria socialis]
MDMDVEHQALQDFFICLGELKRSKSAIVTDIDNEIWIEQITRYLHHVLDAQNRDEIYGFLTNLDSIRFYRVENECRRSLWILLDERYICTVFHPRLKRFDAEPHEKDLAFDLVKQKLLARTSISRITTDTTSKAVTTNVSIINDSTVLVNPNNLLACCFDKPRAIVSSVTATVKELDDCMELIVPGEESDDIFLF